MTTAAETPCVTTGQRGAFGKIHLYRDTPEVNAYGGAVVSTLCGRTGFASHVDLTRNPRDICSICAWRSRP